MNVADGVVVGAEPEPAAPTATDPVCGMSVDPMAALSVAHAGRDFHSCSPHCRDTFTTHPAAHLTHHTRS